MSKSIETQAKSIEAAIEDALAQLGASYDEVDVDIIQEAGFLKKAKVKVTLKATAKEEVKKEVEKPTTTTAPAPTKEEPKQETKTTSTVIARNEETKQSQKDPQDIKPSEKETKQEKKADKPAKTVPPLAEGELPKKFQATLDFTKKFIELLGNESEITYEITEKSFNINANGTGVGQIIGKGGEVMNAIQTIISSIAIANSNGENKRVYFNVEDYKERRGETLKALAVRKAEKVKETGRFIKLEPMNARDRAIIHSALQEIEGIRTYSTGKDPHRCLCIAPKKDSDS